MGLIADQSKTMEAQFNRLQQEVADKVEESKTTMAAKEEVLEGAMAEMAKEASRVKGELDGELSDVREQWRTEVDGLKEERSSLQIELASVHGKMEGVSTMIEGLQKERDAHRVREEELQETVAGLREELIISMSGANNQLGGMEATFTHLQAAHKTSSDKLTKAKEELEAQVAELQRQLEQAAVKAQEVEAVNVAKEAALQTAISQLEKKASTFIANADLPVDVREEWRSEVDRLKEERSSLQIELASVQGKLEGVSTMIEGLQKERDEHRTREEELQETVAGLREELTISMSGADSQLGGMEAS